MVTVELGYGLDFYVCYFCSAQILLRPRITLAVGGRIKKGFSLYFIPEYCFGVSV